MLLWSELLLVTKSVQGAGDFEERFCCASCTSKRGDQFATAYREINPQMVVPTLDRRRHQAVSVVGHPRIPGGEISGAAAIASRCGGAGLGARDRAGLQANKRLLTEHPSSGVFCHGDRPTIADICLVTQATPAKTFNLALGPYPRVMRIYDNCMAIRAFADAHPAK
ncbi:MAG TPA: hypothetical protein VFW40_11920 [Capsulimonadaceae bacterium]|nr:hypothetical protein [Capsulimonadaceae bacterium]